MKFEAANLESKTCIKVKNAEHTKKKAGGMEGLQSKITDQKDTKVDEDAISEGGRLKEKRKARKEEVEKKSKLQMETSQGPGVHKFGPAAMTGSHANIWTPPLR